MEYYKEKDGLRIETTYLREPEFLEMRIEAKYYSKEGIAVVCGLCPNRCRLMEGQTGLCRSRKVINGALYSMSYANPCAIHVDPIEKKPLFHFFPGSETFSLGVAGCLLHCQNCQNYTISQAFPEALETVTFPPEDVVSECFARHCDSISYTYTEPFAFFEYTLETAKQAKSAGLKNIIVSSGFVNEEPLRELMPYIDAANIDLKCFSHPIYKSLCKGDLEVVLRNIKIIHESNCWLELTNLVIPGYTDDLDMIGRMCQWLVINGMERVPLHFSRFFPQYRLENVEATPLKTIEKAVMLAKEAGLRYVYSGNVAAPSDTHCPHCNTPLIRRMGYSVWVDPSFTGQCVKCYSLIDGRF